MNLQALNFVMISFGINLNEKIKRFYNPLGDLTQRLISRIWLRSYGIFNALYYDTIEIFDSNIESSPTLKVFTTLFFWIEKKVGDTTVFYVTHVQN